MHHASLLLILACCFGFFMAWGIGANDVANAVGTAVGAKSITIMQALWIAAIFEFLGAVLAGGEVTDTIRSGIIQANQFVENPEYLVYGMLAALLASGVWLLTATHFGWPVSTTHSIVGAIIGFAVIVLGVNSVRWIEVVFIFLSWVITPIIAGALAFLLFLSIEQLILRKAEPEKAARQYLPFYIFVVAYVISGVTLLQGLQHVIHRLSYAKISVICFFVSAVVMLLAFIALKRLKYFPTVADDKFYGVEKTFGVLMIFTACAMAFAHGSNDVANAIGPVAAIVAIVQSGGNVSAQAPLPLWILVFGALGIILGLAMHGYKVIATIGTNITLLTPSRGFAASLATAITVILASGTGLPISTTQTLVGAVLGVGIARGVAAINLRVVSGIFMSWIITLPVGAVLCVLFFWILKSLLSV